MATKVFSAMILKRRSNLGISINAFSKLSLLIDNIVDSSNVSIVNVEGVSLT